MKELIRKNSIFGGYDQTWSCFELEKILNSKKIKKKQRV